MTESPARPASPFIVRRLPHFDVLDEDQLAKLEAQVDWVLQEVGIAFRDDPEALDLWRREGLEQIEALQNSDIKISGLGNTIEGWTTEKIRPYVLEAIDIFGPERVSFGSNFPTDRQFSSMGAIWQAFDTILDDFDRDTRARMLIHNPVTHYRL